MSAVTYLWRRIDVCYIFPALFENAFKSRYSNTDPDAKCFDPIRSTYVFDVGRIMQAYKK